MSFGLRKHVDRLVKVPEFRMGGGQGLEVTTLPPVAESSPDSFSEMHGCSASLEHIGPFLIDSSRAGSRKLAREQYMLELILARLRRFVSCLNPLVSIGFRIAQARITEPLRLAVGHLGTETPPHPALRQLLGPTVATNVAVWIGWGSWSCVGRCRR